MGSHIPSGQITISISKMLIKKFVLVIRYWFREKRSRYEIYPMDITMTVFSLVSRVSLSPSYLRSHSKVLVISKLSKKNKCFFVPVRVRKTTWLPVRVCFPTMISDYKFLFTVENFTRDRDFTCSFILSVKVSGKELQRKFFLCSRDLEN